MYAKRQYPENLAVARLARALDPEPQHCFQVRANAAQLFLALAPLHGLGPEAWRLLEAAALLHDIGHRRGYARHHKHSRDMILALDLPGFLPEERELIAQIARYHRRSAPKLRHRRFATLAKEKQVLVSALAALLRLADGLDRAHTASVAGVSAEITPSEVVLHVTQRRACPADLAGALRKAALFESHFVRRLRVYGEVLHSSGQPAGRPDTKEKRV